MTTHTEDTLLERLEVLRSERHQYRDRNEVDEALEQAATAIRSLEGEVEELTEALDGQTELGATLIDGFQQKNAAIQSQLSEARELLEEFVDQWEGWSDREMEDAVSPSHVDAVNSARTFLTRTPAPEKEEA